MYLKSLEVQGFKSFADKTVLKFGSDITAVVGPNGSGKSNISDAIRWVMGEQSTKALRGGKMEDVIFGGTQKRPQLGFAEASLILDNTDGAFPVDSSEIMVTRRYYRSGESEFFINRQAARLRDINELFMDTGLGKEGYSNISQGRIDEILSLKSTDRREIFEEAAGISRFRHRKEETERKLAQTEENLLRVGDKISELSLQLEPLRRQAEQAQRYLALRDELKGIEAAVWMTQLGQLSETKKKAETDYSSAAFILAQEQESLDGLYRKAEELSDALHTFDLNMERKRAELTDADAEIQRIAGEISLLRASVGNNESNLRQLRAELEAQESRNRSIRDRITRSEESVNARSEELTQTDAELSALEAEYARVSSRCESVSADALAIRSRLSELRIESARSLAEMEDASEKEAQEKQRLAVFERESAEAKSKHDALKQEKEDCAAELKRARESAVTAKNVLEGFRLRSRSREEARTELQSECSRLQISIDTAASRIRLLEDMEKEYEGFSRSVRVVMQEAERGTLRRIHGPVSRLIRTEEDYAVAIETALGPAMQQIVVSDENDGKAAIRLLKQRDAGRATFLPLSVIRGRPLQERGVEETPGFVGIASDLVSCDGAYREIILNLLGRTVIAEDLDYAIPMAKRFSNRFRIVTLDGQVLNAGGSMTGGSSSNRSGFLSRANELSGLRLRLEEEHKRLDARKARLAAAEKEAEELKRETEASASRLREAEDQVLRQEAKLKQYEALLEAQETLIGTEHRVLTDSTAAVERARERCREKAKQREALELQIAALDEKLGGLEENRTELSRSAQETSARLSALRLRRSAAAAEQTAAEETVRQLFTLLEQLQSEREQKETLLSRYAEENENSLKKIAQLGQEQEHARTVSGEKREELSALAGSRLASEEEKTLTERGAQEKNREILDLQRECARLEQKKLSAELEEKQLIDKLWETYELTPATAAPCCAKLESMAQGQRKISELKRKLSSLGTPNLGAIEEFARVNDRYQYLETQRGDVLDSRRALEEIVQAITKEMTAIFTEEFGKINKYFSATFTEMFGGGSASLILEEPEHPLECGIEIRVQPPGKQLKTITLLSGGEKAFVAIALYFAILKVRPTPFCMLDEIDAALDDRNVERFASYLRSLSKMTQFIVITHRRGTMEAADILYGVTMQEQGVSKILFLDLNQMSDTLGITE